eukprot:scaffold120_cov279-Chaetoceros_neogracile.AAC.1
MPSISNRRGARRPGGSRSSASTIIYLLLIGGAMAILTSLIVSIFAIQSTNHIHGSSSDEILLGHSWQPGTSSISTTTSSSSSSSNNQIEIGSGNANHDPTSNRIDTTAAASNHETQQIMQQRQRQRTQAIRQAALQTATIIQKEKQYQILRNKAKEIYLQQLEVEDIKKTVQQEEYEKEQHEQKYYMYYEDSNDLSSTVIGITYSSDLSTYQRFIGSLRNTGFGGRIILGMEDFSPQNHHIVEYLHANNVTIKSLNPIECTFESAKERQKCYRPYPHIKREWAFFPLARDYLSACESCLGPIIFAFPESTFFQHNPFGAGMPIVKRLHLYEQHPSVDVSTTSAGVLMKACVDIDLKAEMEGDDPDIEPRGILSAATALGTRDDIIGYLGLVYSIIREWMLKSECHFHHSSNDMGMAIVNFLRVKDRLPYRTRIMIHRMGIVNNVEFEGTNAIDAHVHLWKFRGLSTEEANLEPYEGAKGEAWIDTDYLVTDEEGDFIDVFFQKSAVIYGYDSYGLPFLTWLNSRLNITEAGNDGLAAGLGFGQGDDAVQQLQTNLDSVKSDLEKGGEKEQQGGGPIIAVGDEVIAKKAKEGYYIDDNTQKELVKNDQTVERKKEIHAPNTDVLNQADKEQMYYAEDEEDDSNKNKVHGNNNELEDDDEDGNKVVPVAETHRKEKIGDEDAESETEAEAAVTAGIQREPVDKKIEIDAE